MKLLIEIKKEDTIGNDYTDCGNCAIAKAVKRVVKNNVYVSEGVYATRFNFGGLDNNVIVLHDEFNSSNFYDLQRSPNGTIHILEMDIPKRFLKGESLKCHTSLKKKEILY